MWCKKYIRNERSVRLHSVHTTKSYRRFYFFLVSARVHFIELVKELFDVSNFITVVIIHSNGFTVKQYENGGIAMEMTEYVR